jgi:hypothetical protein
LLPRDPGIVLDGRNEEAAFALSEFVPLLGCVEVF